MRKIPLALLTRARPARFRPRRLAALVILPLLAALLALLDGGLLPLPAAPSFIPGTAGAPGASGLPGALTPGQIPAAEAWGREFKRSYQHVRNASDVTDEELGDTVNDDAGRCQIEIDRDNPYDVRGGGKDYFCYSYTDRAIVTITIGPYWRNGNPQSKPYRAYVSTGRAVPDAQAWHPNVQTTDSRDRILGRRGLAEYNGVVHSDSDADNHERNIVLTRDMASPNRLYGGSFWPARNDGSVFLTIYAGPTRSNDGASLNDLPGKINAEGELEDLRYRQPTGHDFVVKVYFIQEFDLDLTWILFPGVEQNGDGTRKANHGLRTGPTPRMSITGNYHPHISVAPPPALDRRYVLNDYWLTGDTGENRYGENGLGNSVAHGIRHAPRDGIKYCIQQRDYASGGYWHPDAQTTVKLVFAPGSNLSGASGEYEETHQERHFDQASGSCRYRYLNGFNPAGPVRAEMRITLDNGQGAALPGQDETGNVEPLTIIIEGPPAHLYLTRTPTTRLSGGTRYVQMQYALTDRLGSPLTGSRARIRWEGADARSRAVIARNGGGGTAGAGRFNFPITDDAPAGFYTLKLTAGDVSRNVSFRVYDLPAPPAAPVLPARITASAVGGGIAQPGGRISFRYTLQDADGNPLSLRANPTTWMADVSSVVDQAGNVDGARQTDGRFGFDIANDAAPGSYTITIRTVATDAEGSPLVSVRISFRVLGNPARYALAGPDQVSPGGYAVYTVTATDPNGNLPSLTGDHGAASISASDGAAVRLFHLQNGSITLDDAGVGRFRLRADRDAAAGSRITITAASLDGAITATKTVAIGAAAR